MGPAKMVRQLEKLEIAGIDALEVAKRMWDGSLQLSFLRTALVKDCQFHLVRHRVLKPHFFKPSPTFSFG